MSYWICFLPLFIALISSRRKKKAAIVIKHRKFRKEKGNMKEMAERLIGQTCIFFSMFSESVGSVQGVIKSLSADGSAVLVEKKNGEQEILNLEYVVRIRPVKKKTKTEH